MRHAGREAGAGRLHQRREAGEAGVDEGGVVDGDGGVRGEAEDQGAHGDAVVHAGGDQAAARGRAAGAVDEEIVARDLDRDAVGGEHGGGGGKPVAFLDAELGEAAHAGGAGGGGGGDGEDGIFVDHRRRAVGRDVGGGSGEWRDEEIAYGLAALGARVLDGDGRAHLGQRGEKAGAEGVEADGVEAEDRAGDEEGGDEGKGGGGGIGGDGDVGGAELGLAGEADAAASGGGLDGDGRRRNGGGGSRCGRGWGRAPRHLVSPRALRPARRIADFTWAEATGRR